ncbi:F-box/kelch-repeat protein At3g06240-like [Rutidosis leptorrhynchoides]|uniref:F-box/kelch-repeat protein At3g06240-like n=1 Tax=Rutidosis leptorrhynchoides TaxID=125765 RepID=UPI003A99A8A3
MHFLSNNIKHNFRFIIIDVAENILARLDVEDVLRCKSVCKLWYNLISSNYFVKAHLKHSYNNNREHGYLRIRLTWMINYNNVTNLHNYMIVGSCHGLVCISSNNGELLVTNPSTREVRKLPMLPYKYRHNVCWGFGYDSLTDDYKIVVGLNESEHHMRFQVLSLKSNKWKFVGEGDYLTYNTNTNDSICGFLYDGALHWFMNDTKKKRKMIVSFDISSEKFKEIPLLNDTKYVYDDRDRVGMFEERLCIYCSYYIDDSYCRKIWVMKNYNWWELVPRDYEGNKYGAATTAYILDNILDKTWLLLHHHEGNEYLLSQSWYHITSPIFVKSLVSPNNKKNIK